MEDLAMAVYLPVVTVMIAGLGFATGSWHVALALALLAAVLLVALRWGHLVSRAVFARQDEVVLLLVLGLGLLVAGVAERLEVSAAVGAFLVGIALSGPVAESARALLTPLRDLFAAVFFVFFGLQTEPGAIGSVLLPACLLALAGIAGKVGTGWYAAKRVGSNTRGRLRAGIVLIPRGEFSIVIAGLAVDGGIEPKLRPLVATYVLILACTGPIAARVADVLSHRARQREA
jgi:CPA2 family monovalent cation:H+ antiporter-2